MKFLLYFLTKFLIKNFNHASLDLSLILLSSQNYQELNKNNYKRQNIYIQVQVRDTRLASIQFKTRQTKNNIRYHEIILFSPFGLILHIVYNLVSIIIPFVK